MSREKYIVIGILIIAIPIFLFYLDLVLEISEGANIGGGILLMFSLPVGLTFLLWGLFWAKKSKKSNRKKTK